MLRKQAFFRNSLENPISFKTANVLIILDLKSGYVGLMACHFMKLYHKSKM